MHQKVLSAVTVLCLLGFVWGCTSESDDPFYQKALKYEETAFKMRKEAVDNKENTPEKFDEIREKAAKEAGFASVKDANSILQSYRESDDPDKKEIAQKVVDLAVEYNKKIKDYIDKTAKQQRK
jgi:hypothetical protein